MNRLLAFGFWLLASACGPVSREKSRANVVNKLELERMTR
jgi:hypothetical protein